MQHWPLRLHPRVMLYGSALAFIMPLHYVQHFVSRTFGYCEPRCHFSKRKARQNTAGPLLCALIEVDPLTVVHHSFVGGTFAPDRAGTNVEMAEKCAYELEREERIRANKLKIQVLSAAFFETTCRASCDLWLSCRSLVSAKQQLSWRPSNQARSSV